MNNFRRIILCVLLSLIIFVFVGCENNYNEDNNDIGNTVANSQPVTDELTQISLSSDLNDFTFKLDDVVYEIPCDIDDFIKNGWEYQEYFDDYNKILDDNTCDSLNLYNENDKIGIEVYNYSGNRKTLKECLIGRINYDFSGDIEFFLADNYLLNGKTIDEVIEKYGKPNFYETYDSEIEIVYEKKGCTWIYERYTLTFDPETKIINGISIVNFIETEETQNNNSDIQYLFNYKAPNSIGNDPASFNVSIMGDIYNLPAPVKEFINNGWEIIETCDVGAGSYMDDSLIMEKDGVVATFSVYNFSDYQVDAKDATIYKVSQDCVTNVDLDFVLSGNIKIGTSKADVMKVISNSLLFQVEESEHSTSYIINKREYMIAISVLESETVESITVINRVCSYK